MSDKEKTPYIQTSLTCSGHLVHDPSIKFLPGKGTAMCEFSLGVSTGKDKPPMWLNCKAFEALAEQITEEYKKGDKFDILSAYPKIEEWEGKDGKKNSKTVWIIKEISSIPF